MDCGLGHKAKSFSSSSLELSDSDPFAGLGEVEDMTIDSGPMTNSGEGRNMALVSGS